MKHSVYAILTTSAMLVQTNPAAAQYPPSAGTDRESEAYFSATEQYLDALDLDDPTLEFDRLGGTTSTNWAVARDGTRIADLKCTEGNTNHHGAIVAYRLGRALAFEIYPVAVYKDVDRSIDGRRVSGQCALKEWAGVLTQYYWTRDTFADTDDRSKRRLIEALKCEQAQPADGDEFTYYARSAYGNPTLPGVRRVPYYGRATLLDAARDFSNMMVVDALIGNEDRFPGGNVFFRSVTTDYRQQDGNITFERARLYSLDNEASFKSTSPGSTFSVRDLRAHVWRFDANVIEALRRLADDDEAALDEIVGQNAQLATFVREGIRIVLEQFDAAVARCGEASATF